MAETNSRNDSREELLKKFCALNDVVAHDLNETIALYEARKDPFSRRLLIRAIIHSVEGELAVHRETMLHMCNRFISLCELEDNPRMVEAMEQTLGVNLSAKEYFELTGLSFADVKRGKERPRQEVLCLKETVRSIFRIHGMIFRPEIMPDFQDNGWKALMTVKEKRNRLTHPRSAQDLEVTERQVHAALAACLWFKQYFDLIRASELSQMRLLLRELEIEFPD